MNKKKFSNKTISIFIMLIIFIGIICNVKSYVNYKVDKKLTEYLEASGLGYCEKFNYDCVKKAFDSVSFSDKIKFITNDSKCLFDYTKESLKDNYEFIATAVSCSLVFDFPKLFEADRW